MIKFEQEVVEAKVDSKPGRHYIAYDSESEWSDVTRLFGTVRNSEIKPQLTTIARTINRNREFLDKFFLAKTLPTLIDRMIQLTVSINNDLTEKSKK